MRKPVKRPRIASSSRCAIELVPAAGSRGLVMVSGWLLLLMGFAIIGHLHAPIELKVVLGGAWIVDTLRELRRQARGQIRVRRLMLDPQGKMIGHDSFRKELKIQILKGSVVLRRWAWLRLGFADGSYYVEFIRRRDCQLATWRRLQLIWRHAG